MLFQKGRRVKKRKKPAEMATRLPSDIEFQVCHDLLRSSAVNDVFRILLACTQDGGTVAAKSQDDLSNYFAGLASQEFILAKDIVTGRIIGFLAYRTDFRPGALRDVVFEHEPLKYLYVTAVAVAPEYRRLGIMRRLYDVLSRQFVAENRLLIARAWDSNESHVKFLEYGGFHKAVTVRDTSREGESQSFFMKTILA